MPSSKGKPTDPKLREEVKEDVKNEPNKDGSGKGQMTAWKGMKISKEYEKRGGDYENEPGTENKPTKGAPEPKPDEQKQAESKEGGSDKKEEKEKPKANSGKKATGKKGDTKAKTKKEKKEPTEGTRKSSRIGAKRSAPTAEDDKEPKEKSHSKKAKTAKK
ncbi:MAG: hypothetical protein LQ351_001044 [Letrouitia transgressa]|nr:MAG: hypothetical protein LQ351_001044 [Letrouitia transgressa]